MISDVLQATVIDRGVNRRAAHIEIMGLRGIEWAILGLDA